MDYSDLDPFKNLNPADQCNLLSSADKLGPDFLSLYRSQLRTDVTLVVQAREFKVHRLILSTRSKYFSDLFEVHQNQKRIELNEPFNLDAFEKILEYIYGGQIVVNTSNANILGLVAQKMHLNMLSDLLESFYGTELTNENVIEQLVAYHNMDNKRGVQQCLLYFDHIFAQYINLKRQLMELPFELMNEIVKRETLGATETSILTFLVDWHENNVRKGGDKNILQKQMQQLSKHLKIHLIAKEDPRPLFNILKPNGWVDIELLWDTVAAKVSNAGLDTPLYKERKPGPKIVRNRRDPFKVAIFGLPRAGKTSILQFFMRKTHPNIEPAPLIVEELEFEGNLVQLRDFNGDEEVRKMWFSEINKGLDAMIWVIDASSALLEENIDHINSLMDFIKKPDLPVLILAHKRDLGLVASATDVEAFLRITKGVYFSRTKRTILAKWRVLASTVIGTEALDEGTKWLVEAMIASTIERRKKEALQRH